MRFVIGGTVESPVQIYGCNRMMNSKSSGDLWKSSISMQAQTLWVSSDVMQYPAYLGLFVQYIVFRLVSHCLTRTDEIRLCDNLFMWRFGILGEKNSLTASPVMGLATITLFFKLLTSVICTFAHTRGCYLIKPLIQRINLWGITSPTLFEHFSIVMFNIWQSTPQMLLFFHSLAHSFIIFIHLFM